MAEETRQPQKLSRKKIRRVQIGFNVLAQIVLILFLAVMVNSIAFKHYARWDFSRDQKYALSDKTKRFLKTIKGKMRITIFFSPNTPITADVQNLLTEYQYAGEGKIDIEHIDPERNRFDVDVNPKDLKAIIIIGPQYDFSDREMKLLRDFRDKQGRILLLLDPSAKTPRLDGFLNELGVKANDDRLMAFLRTGIQELALTRDVQAHFLGDSPITKRLAGANALFFGGTSSLTLAPDRGRSANIRIQPLVQAEKGYFAETDYNTEDQVKLQADAKRN